MTVLSLLAALLVFQTPDPAALHEAARGGDVDAVQAALDAGVDVNAATRYGVTALFFAADRGHVKTVELLLARGADVNATDTFYKATPLVWALNNGHLEVVRRLLEKGGQPAAAALGMAVSQKDMELARLALAGGKVDQSGLNSALKRAEQAGHTDMADLLRENGAGQSKPLPVFQMDPGMLKRFAGHYRNEDQGVTAEVRLDQSTLTLLARGFPNMKLTPTSESTFRVGDLEESSVSFSGRGGTIERMVFAQPGRTLVLSPYTPGEAPAAAAAKPEPAPSSTAADEPVSYPRLAASNWPAFRGQSASGVADGQAIPTAWDTATGGNIRWTVAMPGISDSSPVIWGDRVFFTTAASLTGNEDFRTGLYGDVKPVDDLSEHEFRVTALDRATGKTLWDKVVYRGKPATRRHPKASQANSTPVTNGEHLIVLFGAIGRMYCFDLQGNMVWEKDLGILDSGWFYSPDYQWGHSSSPIIYRNSVIVQADVQKQSWIAAFDLSSGKELWRTARDEIPTWSTPNVVPGPQGDELVVNGTTIHAYDPRSGKGLWSLSPNSEIIVATPITGHDLIFLTSGYPPVRPIYAVRPGSRGDLTLPDGQSSSRSVVWSHNRGGTYIPTPIVYGEYLYLFANNGRLTCYRATTGERVYRARVGQSRASFSASPVASDGRLFFTSETGDVHVVRAGPKFEELAHNQFDDIVMATPAISDGVMVFKGMKNIYAVGSKP